MRVVGRVQCEKGRRRQGSAAIHLARQQNALPPRLHCQPHPTHLSVSFPHSPPSLAPQVEAVSGELRGIIDEMQEVVAALQIKLQGSAAPSAQTYAPLSSAAAAVAEKWQSRMTQVPAVGAEKRRSALH